MSEQRRWGTPGPWSQTKIALLLRYGRKNSGPWDEEEPGDDPGNLPTDYDAELVAAAPELLEACERALETIEYLWSGKYASRLYDNETKKQVQAAIAKATGGDSCSQRV